MDIKKKILILFFPIFLALIYSTYCLPSEVKIAPPVFIAHAGGGINNRTYTNSLEALNSNYEKGYRFFEIDFSWTSDNELVAIHDWANAFQQMFYVSASTQIPTQVQFLQLESKTGLTQLSLVDVLKWADEKGDAFIVTDIKDDNIKALTKIGTDFKKYKKYIIPQVYNYKEYSEAIKLGYSNIILTLYRMKIDPLEVLDFSKHNSPFAITMHWKFAQSGLAYYLHQNNTRVYAHTVNDVALFSSLRKIGVYGIYTDFITPP